MIKYIGSKRVLVPDLVSVTGAIQPTGSVIDLFSGTSRVGHALKARGYRVLANDHNAYAETLGMCYVAADREEHERDASRLIREFNALPGRAGYFTDVFCERSRFFQPKNGARVDAIRDEIERKGLPPELKAVLLVSLMEAADRVDSTTGVQMAYLKQWAARAHNNIELRMPALLPRAHSGKGEAWRLDAEAASAVLEADVCYLDPPYNQHKYLGNYHVWESLVLWDKPEVYGIACKRVDCRERGSAFNSKPLARSAMEAVITGARAKHLVVSFNNEGYFSRTDIEAMLASRGEVVLFAHDFKRYVGAQIGIHNLKGEKVGEVSHLRNTEYIYVASRDAAVIERLRAMGGRFGHELPMQPAQSTIAVAAQHSGAAVPAMVRPVVTDLRQQLEVLVHDRRSLSSAEAQAATGADSGALRAAFRSLVAAGTVAITGVTRGTRYVSCGGPPLTASDARSEATPDDHVSLRHTAVAPPYGGSELRDAVMSALRARTDCSSQDIQRLFTVDVGELRGILKTLIAEGLVETTGQRRGMRYRLMRRHGSVDAATPPPTDGERRAEQPKAVPVVPFSVARSEVARAPQLSMFATGPSSELT